MYNCIVNYCSQCGAKLKSIGKFCSACGAPTTNLIEKDADAPLISQKEMITQSAASTDSQAARAICLHKNKVIKSNGVTKCEDCGEYSLEKHVELVKNKATATQWIKFSVGFVLCYVALTNLSELHSPIEYVSLNLSPNTLLNGGWWIGYTDHYASLLRATEALGGSTKGVFKIGELQTALWIVGGLGLGLADPILKRGFKELRRKYLR